MGAFRRKNIGTSNYIPEATSIVASQTNIALTAVGQTAGISARVEDQRNRDLVAQPAITMDTLDHSVATVSGGIVTAVAIGNTTLRITSGALTLDVPLSVAAVVASVTIAPLTPSISVGGTQQFTRTAKDASNNVIANATGTWSSSDPLDFPIDANGLVTANSAGSAVIKWQADNGVYGTTTITATPVSAAPGAPTASNATAQTTSSLTFPVTLNGSGSLPTALAWRYSTDNATWTNGSDITLTSPTLGQTVSKTVTVPSASTLYYVQFAEKNSTGTSAFCTSATGTTSAAAGTATPLLRDNLGYVTMPVLLTNVQPAGGGTGTSSSLYSGITPGSSAGPGQLVTDRAAEALYNGFASLRYDFLPTTGSDTTVNITAPLPTSKAKVWWRSRIKFKPGFTTAGTQQAGNAQAYKLLLYGFTNGMYFGSGRLEISNTTQWDNYFTVFRQPSASGTVTANAGAATFSVSQANNLQNGDVIVVGGTSYTISAFDGVSSCTLSGTPTFAASSFSVNQTTVAAPNTAGPNIVNEWTDDNWYDFIMCSTVSADGKTRTTKWWHCIDGQTPVLLSVCSGAPNNGVNAPDILTLTFGANFNQPRNTTVSLWRGPWDSYDASIYNNPYGVPSADLTDISSTLGSDASTAAPVVAPAVPGVCTPSNASSATTSSLTFPVTLAASGGLPTALLVQYSTNGGTTWNNGADIGLISPTLGGSINAQVVGLPRNTAGIQVKFQEYNAGGVSAWSSVVTGTTPNVDTLPVTSGLVVQLEADTNVVSSAGLVSQITDSSATGLVIAQATGTAQPTLRAGASPTGLPGIDFDTGKYMVAGAYNAALATANKTVFVVGVISGANSNERHMWSNLSDVNHGYAMGCGGQSGSDQIGYRFGFGTSNYQPNGTARSTTAHSWAFESGIASTSHWGVAVDGGNFSGDGNNMSPNTVSPVALGTYSYAPGSGTGVMTWYATYEFNRVLTTTEYNQMVAFIRQKWGTP